MSNYLSNIIHKHFVTPEKLQPRLPGWFEPWPIAAQQPEVIDISPLDQLEAKVTGLEPQRIEPAPKFENTQPPPVPPLTLSEEFPMLGQNPESPPAIPTTHLTTPTLSSPHVRSPSPLASLEHSYPASEPTPNPSPSPSINKEIVVKRIVLEEETVIKPKINRVSDPPEIVMEQQGPLTVSIPKSQKNHSDTVSQPLTIVRPRDESETQVTKAEHILPMAQSAEFAPIPPHLASVLPKKRTHESILANPTSTIQVSIGRIEVRATPPARSVPKKRATLPIMSLDDYLQQRRGGTNR